MRGVERFRRSRREHERRRLFRRRHYDSDEEPWVGSLDLLTPAPSDPWLEGQSSVFELPAQEALKTLSVGGVAFSQRLSHHRMISRFMWDQRLQWVLTAIGEMGAGAATGALVYSMCVAGAMAIAGLAFIVLNVVEHLAQSPGVLLGLAINALPMLVVLALWGAARHLLRRPLVLRRLNTHMDPRRDGWSRTERDAERHRLMLHLLSRLGPAVSGDVSCHMGKRSWSLKASLAKGAAVVVRIDETPFRGPVMRFRLTADRPLPLRVVYPAGMKAQVRRTRAEDGSHEVEVTGLSAADALGNVWSNDPAVTLADLLGQAVTGLTQQVADTEALRPTLRVDEDLASLRARPVGSGSVRH
ncbi:MAG: hypothetical protein AAFS10_28045, partial [Myxococcota bacterium]